jgi:hypothetical protein
MSQLPRTIQDFIEQQTTVLVANFFPDDPEEELSPYARYWYRAIACMLLSGRVAPKADGYPNRTDVNRLCKEANFNQYWFERIGKFLISAAVLQHSRQDRYQKGPNFATFWRPNVEALAPITREAVLKLVREHTGRQVWHPTTVEHSHLIEFLILFFGCFKERALREDQVGRAFHDFCTLPEQDLVQAAKGFRLKTDAVQPADWKHWLDAKGQSALVSALYTAEWAYYTEQGKIGWFMPSPIGLGMLGLDKVPPIPPLSTDLQVLPNHCIFAGAGLDMDKLACLFRTCRIKRIDQVFEFQLDRRRLAETPSQTSPGAELRAVLKDQEPLPATVMALLETPSKLGGVIAIRGCSALVKPETPEVLSAIREHPKLRGHLETGAPPGYLLVKSTSDPGNFVRRCGELGFEVRIL